MGTSPSPDESLGLSTDESLGRRSTVRRRLSMLAVTGTAVAVTGIAVYAGTRDDEPEMTASTVPRLEPASSTVLVLSAGGLNMSAATCPTMDSTLVAQATIAFRGTVTMHGEGVVDLAVDQTYAGVGDEVEVITLTASKGVDYWLGPVSWEVEHEYFVTADSGVVSFCGATGEATPELWAIFDQAFPT